MAQYPIDSILLRLMSSVPLLRRLEREDLVALLRNSSKAVFRAGETVFEEGYEGHSMYLVVQGRFEVFSTNAGVDVRLAEITPGEHFGEIAIIASRPRTASVRALEDSTTLRFTRAAIFSEPRTAMLLMRNIAVLLAERLTDANDEIILHRSTGRRWDD